MKTIQTLVLATALSMAAGLATAQSQGQWMSPHMMGSGGGGYGPGPGAGMMGPGMMGGGAGGYGPGMMGGWGGSDGSGMMGGQMMGAGIAQAVWALDLSDAQRSQLTALQDEQRRRHWELAGRMHDEMAKLRDAWWGGGQQRDRAAIVAAYKRMSELRLQALEVRLDGADRLDEILTAEQREQLRRSVPWWPRGRRP